MLIALIVICMIIGFIACTIDEAVDSHIEAKAPDHKTAVERKRMYNTIGHMVVRSIDRNLRNKF